MFDDLKQAWITEIYKSYRGILLPSMSSQLSTQGLILDLDSLPLKPLPFKELFIRWVISVNKKRISKKESILITKEIVLQCPLWKIVKCPLKKMNLTKEGMFNKPKKSVGTFGTVPTFGSINK